MLCPSSIRRAQRFSFSSTGAQSVMGILESTASSCISPLARKVESAPVNRNMPIFSRMEAHIGIFQSTASTLFLLPLYHSKIPIRKAAVSRSITARANQQKI